MREPLSYPCGLIISSARPFDIFFFGLNFITSILVMMPFHKGVVVSVLCDKEKR